MAELAATPIISAVDLSVAYGAQVVLQKSSVAIHEGERVGLLGRNGSGKSTFLRILAGEVQPDSGNVVRRRDLIVGYLPQTFELAEEQTVYENVIAGAAAVTALIRAYEETPA